MNYLITAAGKGSRFTTKGLKSPKPLIKVYGIELLIWSLNSFKFNEGDNLYIVTLAIHKVKKLIKKKVLLIFPNINIFWLELDYLPQGQLKTALEAINYFNIQGPLIIHNCDTFYSANTEEISQYFFKENCFGVIPCFKGKGDHWSFFKTRGGYGSEVLQVKEKMRISENCSIGTYAFKSCKELLKLSSRYLREINSDFSEYYIAPIFQYALDNSKKVYVTESKNIKLFGTLDELLETFQISLRELLGENAWDSNQTNTLVVDIDKTICQKEENETYKQAKPIISVCNALKEAEKEGYYIILFTSRNMRSFRGSLGLINKYTAPELISWLSKNKIPYDEIYFGKPWGNSVEYIDDKFLSIEDFIKRKYID